MPVARAPLRQAGLVALARGHAIGPEPVDPVVDRVLQVLVVGQEVLACGHQPRQGEEHLALQARPVVALPLPPATVGRMRAGRRGHLAEAVVGGVEEALRIGVRAVRVTRLPEGEAGEPARHVVLGGHVVVDALAGLRPRREVGEAVEPGLVHLLGRALDELRPDDLLVRLREAGPREQPVIADGQRPDVFEGVVGIAGKLIARQLHEPVVGSLGVHVGGGRVDDGEHQVDERVALDVPVRARDVPARVDPVQVGIGLRPVPQGLPLDRVGRRGAGAQAGQVSRGEVQPRMPGLDRVSRGRCGSRAQREQGQGEKGYELPIHRVSEGGHVSRYFLPARREGAVRSWSSSQSHTIARALGQTPWSQGSGLRANALVANHPDFGPIDWPCHPVIIDRRGAARGDPAAQ